MLAERGGFCFFFFWQGMGALEECQYQATFVRVHSSSVSRLQIIHDKQRRIHLDDASRKQQNNLKLLDKPKLKGKSHISTPFKYSK